MMCSNGRMYYGNWYVHCAVCGVCQWLGALWSYILCSLWYVSMIRSIMTLILYSLWCVPIIGYIMAIHTMHFMICVNDKVFHGTDTVQSVACANCRIYHIHWCCAVCDVYQWQGALCLLINIFIPSFVNLLNNYILSLNQEKYIT